MDINNPGTDVPKITLARNHGLNTDVPEITLARNHGLNTKLMFSSKTDLYATPQPFFDELHKEFKFGLDVCALPENAKCPKYYTPEMDGLSQPWTGICWCNPPYGPPIGQWVRRAAEAAADGATVVMLLPARTDTRWFHEYIYGKPGVEIRFVKGRLKFGDAKNAAPFPSMVVIFRPAAGEENGPEALDSTLRNRV